MFFALTDSLLSNIFHLLEYLEWNIGIFPFIQTKFYFFFPQLGKDIFYLDILYENRNESLKISVMNKFWIWSQKKMFVKLSFFLCLFCHFIF